MPIICLIKVAAITTVHQVIRLVGAARGVGLKMVHRELVPGVDFGDTAILTSVIGSLADLFAQLLA